MHLCLEFINCLGPISLERSTACRFKVRAHNKKRAGVTPIGAHLTTKLKGALQNAHNIKVQEKEALGPARLSPSPSLGIGLGSLTVRKRSLVHPDVDPPRSQSRTPLPSFLERCQDSLTKTHAQVLATYPFLGCQL